MNLVPPVDYPVSQNPPYTRVLNSETTSPYLSNGKILKAAGNQWICCFGPLRPTNQSAKSHGTSRSLFGGFDGAWNASRPASV